MSSYTSQMIVLQPLPNEIIMREDVGLMLDTFSAESSYVTNDLSRIVGGNDYSEDANDRIDFPGSPFLDVSDFNTFLQTLIGLLDEKQYPMLVMQEQTNDEERFWGDVTVITRNNIYYYDLQKVMSAFVEAVVVSENDSTLNPESKNIHAFVSSLIKLPDAIDSINVASKVSNKSINKIVGCLINEPIEASKYEAHIKPNTLSILNTF